MNQIIPSWTLLCEVYCWALIEQKEQKLASHARILPDALSTKKVEELSKFHDGLLMKDHDMVKRNKKPKSTINGFTWQKWPKTIKHFLIVLVK